MHIGIAYSIVNIISAFSNLLAHLHFHVWAVRLLRTVRYGTVHMAYTLVIVHVFEERLLGRVSAGLLRGLLRVERRARVVVATVRLPVCRHERTI